MLRSDFTVMAPVGSLESLAAAIRAGADAVYFGVEGLNMRARSSANFTVDDLRDIARRCRAHGVATYLTVNTTVYDSEFGLLDTILEAAAQAGISAIIASDIAVITRAAELGLPVHISTQCNITNVRAVRFYARWADTVVLARELSLEQVAAIHEAILREGITGPSGRPVRIEMFCHGALCMAESGKCYLSLHQLNSSANRGSCTQICRRAYTVTDRETGEQLDVENRYIMSPKDLKTIHFLDRMVDAGVTVFKIEGRARGPEYVRATVECYDAALRAIVDGSYGEALVAEWDSRLGRVFNRGFWNGYYLGQRLGEWSGKYGSSATRVKQYVAKGVRYYSRLGVGEFRMEAGVLRPGDEVLVTGPVTGALEFTVEELRLDGPDAVGEVRPGVAFALPVPAKVRPSDRLYLLARKDGGGGGATAQP